jgi:hypothetical protein
MIGCTSDKCVHQYGHSGPLQINQMRIQGKWILTQAMKTLVDATWWERTIQMAKVNARAWCGHCGNSLDPVILTEAVAEHNWAHIYWHSCRSSIHQLRNFSPIERYKRRIQSRTIGHVWRWVRVPPPTPARHKRR